jgi:hypothetical protein
MNRFCIITGPRSGSTWLELMIYEALKNKYNNTVRLGEFFNPGLQEHENYTSINGLIEQSATKSITSDFFKIRLNLLLDNSHSQPAVLRYFPQSYYYNYNYTDLLNRIIDVNFRCITLYRNVLERALSWCLMETTKYIHKFSDRYTINDNNVIRSVKDLVEKAVYIDVKHFEVKLNQCIEDHSNIVALQKISDAVILNYDTLINDCIINNIPIKEDIYIHKLRTTPNDKIISNYDELIKIYETYTNSQ